MAEVIIINPTKNINSEDNRLKVGAYIRVSSDSDDQGNSYIVQYDYYSKLIASNPDWIFIDIYADEGITGTETGKRDDFNRMLEDCQKRKLDLILTKSVSRFARNTLDCIEVARKLKLLGIGIKFEKENLNTMEMASEIELAILGTIAQEESVSISENVRMGVRFRMRNGTYKQVSIPYGFEVENDIWKINEEQAKIVRLIFNSYVNGMGLRKIASQLTEANVIKNDGNSKWLINNLSYIIRNVRYKGDALLQKTYKDEFPYKKKKNNGELDMYYIKNANPPIVDAEIFDKANRLIKEQAELYKGKASNEEHVLYQKIYCQECGTKYRRKRDFWMCRTKDQQGSLCSSHQIAEQDVYKGYVNMHNRLVNNTEIILIPIVSQLTELRNRILKDTGIVENINKEIAELSEQILMYQTAKNQGYMESALFLEESNKVNDQIRRLKKEKKLILGNDECNKIIKKTEFIINILNETGAIGDMDENIFKTIVDKIWIDKEKNITYELINGLKLTVKREELR